MKSRFGKHLLLWLMILPMISLVILPLFGPASWFQLSDKERSANRSALGQEKHRQVEDNAAQRFKAWFVDTGTVSRSMERFADQSRERVIGVEPFYSSMSERWIVNVWLSLHRAMYRLEISLYWYLGILILVGATFFDGVVQRRIGQYEFNYANPVFFHVTGHLLILGLGALLLLPLMPFSVSRLAWPLIGLLLCAVAWHSAKHFQTGA